MSPEVRRRPWSDLDIVARFLCAATALVDKLDEQCCDIEIGGVRLGHRNAGTQAVQSLCDALHLRLAVTVADVLWSRDQWRVSGWNRDELADGLLHWLSDQGVSTVIL